MKGIKRFTLFDGKKDGGSPGTSLAKPDKAGYLEAMSGSTSFLSREKWKRRYFVLVEGAIYKFSKKEDAKSENVRTQRCAIIGLEGYDICQPDENDNRRQNVFILDATIATRNQNPKDSRTSIAKLVFSADTKEEMQDWIANVRQALVRVRRPQRPPRGKSASAIHPSSPSALSGHKNDEGSESNSHHLYSPTKYRVKGPRGRRLPQKSRFPKEFTDKFRSPSLCELEPYDSNEEIERAEEFSSGGGGQVNQPLRQRAKSISNGNLAYQYSSSDESVWKDKATKRIECSEIDDLLKEDSHTPKPPPEYKKDAPNVKVAKLPPLKMAAANMAATVDASTTSSKVDSGSPQGEGSKSPGPVMLLSAKLTELRGGLSRFQRHAKEELMAVKDGLTDIKRHLENYPTESATSEIVLKQTSSISADLSTAESDLVTLLEVSQRLENFLQEVQDKCNETFNKLASSEC